MPSINVGTLEGTDNSETLRGGILHYPFPGDSRYDEYMVVQYIVGYGGDDTIYASPMPATQVINGTAYTYDFGTGIFGGTGNDQIFGEIRNDTLGGQAGNDFIDGGDGDDFMAGDEGSDVVLGGGGNDQLSGGEGDDFVDGGTGDDVIDYEHGTDTLLGGAGDDRFHLINLASAGSVDGGNGVDTVLTGFLGGLSFSNVEVLDTIGWDHAFGTISQLQSFSTITSSGGADSGQLKIGLSGEGGELDFSTRMAAQRSVWVVDSGVASGYTITGSFHGDYLTGSGFADVLSGGDGDDNVVGEEGNDLLKGGTGVDGLHGGAGIDTVDYSDKSQTVSVVLTGVYHSVVMVEGLVEDTIADIENVIGGSGADSLTGDDGANLLAGGAGADTLSGGAGDDILRGGLGKDVLDGGADVDTADYSDRSGAVVLTLAGVANAKAVVAGAVEDTVRNIENVFGGSGNDRLTGDGGANVLLGGAGNDILKGALGSDILNGGTGVDTADYSDRTASVSVTLAGGWEVELTVGGVVEDMLQNIENVIGGSGADRLNGDHLANSLDGGAGADTMAGRLGDDTYVVDQSGDVVTEFAGEGTDTVNAWVGWTLGANLEQLRLMGTADLNGTGNGLNNALFGNAGKNVLNGGAGADTMTGGRGDDTYIVDQSDDVVVELTNGGTDLVQSSAASYRLGANVENLVLTGDGSIAGTGNLGRNVLTGNAGNNLLDGGAGADTMAGGEGDDTYVVDNAGDVVTELTNGGTDVVRSSVSHVLSANVENLTLLGKAKLNATGNELDNLLTGNAGRNVLDGGLGADVLAGGGGGDTFRFSTALGPDNVDRIVLFNHKADTIQLDQDVFAALGTGALAAGAFNLGVAASQADDRLLFDTASKSLYYDADGLGGTDAVRFATIDTLQGVLDHTDFLIV